jgi:hypothetical protein
MNAAITLATWAAWGVSASYMLWVFFNAVMNLRDMRDRGVLVGPLRYPAYFTLGVGYALDAFVNCTVIFVVLWEQPSIQFGKGFWKESEWTVSERTKRWATTQPNTWRGKLCQYLRKYFLGPVDKSGAHD